MYSFHIRKCRLSSLVLFQVMAMFILADEQCLHSVTLGYFIVMEQTMTNIG